MPLSGKTTVADILSENGYTVLDMGEVVRIEMEKQGVEPGNEGQFVNSLRDKHGMDAIAQLSVPYLEEILQEKERVVITGMRGWNEKKKFEEETDEEIEVLGVWSSRETRKERREERQREEDIQGQNFHKRDLREVKNGVGKLMALSDYMIKNEEDLDRLEEKVEDVVS
jgi:dephospho-CoA kinase